MNSNLSENLKKIRKDNNLSQEALASLLGVSRQAISKWESKVSYPEMDKIVLICKKFNLSMDDLLHKDIKNSYENEKVSKRINEYFDNIINGFVNSFELFYRMTFNTKVKFILEEIIIAILLFLIWLLGAKFGGYILFSVFKKITRNVYGIIYNVFSSLYIILGLIFNIIIILKLYKVRYYDCYISLKEESVSKGDNTVDSKNSKDNNLVCKDLGLTNNEHLGNTSLNQNINTNQSKIIIKNTSTGDEMFFNLLTKIVIGLFKVMLIPIVGLLSFTLVGLIISLIGSFLILKSKLFFVGVFISVIGFIILDGVVLIFLLNLIFNRQSKIKLMLNAFLGSLVLLGLGLGFSLVSLIGFSDSLTIKKYWKSESIEIPMQDNLFLSTNNNEEINFVEAESDNVRIEYSINEACHIEDRVHLDGYLYLRSSCTNKNLLLKELIDSVNNNEIYNFSDNVHNINNVTIYANNNNLDIIKNNMEN